MGPSLNSRRDALGTPWTLLYIQAYSYVPTKLEGSVLTTDPLSVVLGLASGVWVGKLCILDGRLVQHDES